MISIKPNDLRISEARLKQALKETDSELYIFLKDAINKFSQVFVNTAKVNAKGMNVAKGLQSHENKLNPLEGGLSTKNMFFYAPYVEFGTRGQTKVPQGFEEIALKYKGKSKFKSEASFKDSLKQWIKTRRYDKVRQGMTTVAIENNIRSRVINIDLHIFMYTFLVT